MSVETTTKPVFVPIALPLKEAQATFRALQVAFQNIGTGAERDMLAGMFSADELREIQGVYARAMYAVGEAIDKAQGVSDEPTRRTRNGDD